MGLCAPLSAYNWSEGDTRFTMQGILQSCRVLRLKFILYCMIFLDDASASLVPVFVVVVVRISTFLQYGSCLMTCE